MTEDDRAAKAARAKAMLKKRQRGKADGATGDASLPPPKHDSLLSTTPSSQACNDCPVNRAESFLLLDQPAAPDNRQDKFDANMGAPLLSYTPAPLPIEALPVHNYTAPAGTCPPDAKVTRSLDPEAQLRLTEGAPTIIQELQYQLRQRDIEKGNDQRAISLLVSEKTLLTSEVQRLEKADSKYHDLQNTLQEERATTINLEEQLLQLRNDRQSYDDSVHDLQARVKDVSERLQEKDRELHVAKSLLGNLETEAERYQRRLRELEEQIQNDDRVERMQGYLRNAQERADEFEFQYTKLKQAHNTLKTEQGEAESQRLECSRKISELEIKHTQLCELHATTLQQLATVVSEKEVLAQDKLQLENKVNSTGKALTELHEKLAEEAATVALNTRQLRAHQDELRSVVRRAEAAEKAQQDLQTEGTGLLHSIDELREKVVELTGDKLRLTEVNDAMTLKLRNSEEINSQLETRLNDLTTQKDALEKQANEANIERDKERVQALAKFTDLQAAHDDLQQMIHSKAASLRNLEAEKSDQGQELGRQLEEIEFLNSLLQAKSKDVLTLQQEKETMLKRDERWESLDQGQSEVNILRRDLAVRELEIKRLQEVVSSRTTKEGPQSLSDELLSSVRQQHTLEMSAAHSQIRALESSVFEANARAHSLKKQIGALEAQLVHPWPAGLEQRSFSPAARPPSRTNSHRRSSVGSQRQQQPTSLSRTIFDQNMSAETRHKRLIGLSMLKARMDSEVGISVTRPSSRASSRKALSPERLDAGSRHSSADEHSRSQRGHPLRRPQFLDDSHIFWCHSCTGDLIVL